MSQKDYNMHQFSGRLAQDPEIKETVNGKLLLKGTLVYSTRSTTDKEGSHANFLDFELWEQMVTRLSPVLKKGTLVLMTGELVQSRWQAQDGSRRRNFRLVGREVALMEIPRLETPEEQPVQLAA